MQILSNDLFQVNLISFELINAVVLVLDVVVLDGVLGHLIRNLS